MPSKYEKWAAWQRAGEAPKLWVGFPYNRLPATWGNGWMAGFTAPTRAAVDAAYAAAMASGGYDEGTPGLRPHFAPNYYAAYVRDPDGNKLHFVCRAEEQPRRGDTGMLEGAEAVSQTQIFQAEGYCEEQLQPRRVGFAATAVIIMPVSENKRDFAARRLPESYEAFVWNDVAIGDLRIGRGLYVVEVLVNRRGTKDGALLTSLDTHADPVRLTRPQYALLIGMTAFEQR